MKGISQPSPINEEEVTRLKARKRKVQSTQEIIDGILSGNRTLLSKAITLVESALPAHQEQAQEIIAACLQRTKSETVHQENRIQKTEYRRQKTEDRRQNSDYRLPITESRIPDPGSSIRVGITGVPGVGKSTFIEALGTYLTSKGHKLAVLAVDPSSARSKGSILGDKTRMEQLASDPNAFIRPSPAAGTLGGVARKTRETIVLCEAAGFDVIFVETVGVGQSETTVHSMVDFFLLLMLAGAGDELQGIKRGIIEMADAIVINKADGDNIAKAKAARAEYVNALHLSPPSGSGWSPVVDICSSRAKTGIENVWRIILEHRETTNKTGYFHQRRLEQNHQVLLATIEEGLRHHFYSRKEIAHAISRVENGIIAGHLNPYQAAQELLQRYFEKL